MNWMGAFIVAGYVALVVAAGWWGLLAAVLHVAVLLLTAPRK